MSRLLGKRKRSDSCGMLNESSRPHKKANLEPYRLILPVIQNGNGGKTPKRRVYGRPHRRRLRRGGTVMERFGKLSWQGFAGGDIQIMTLACRKWEPRLDVSTEDEVLEDARYVLAPLFQNYVQ